MRKRWHWAALILFLLITGLIITSYKVIELGYPIRAGQVDESWTLQSRIQIQPGDGPVRVDLLLPAATPGFSRLQEDFISRGFGLSVQDGSWRREANWTIRRAGSSQTLYYRTIFYPDEAVSKFAPDPPYPPIPDLEEPFFTAMMALVEDVRRQSADISSFTTEMLARANRSTPSDEMALFLNEPEFRGDRVHIVRTLLAGAQIPTERINALMLQDTDRRADVQTWLAVHDGSQWQYFNPRTGQRGLPESMLVWWLGDGPPVQVQGGELTDLQFSVTRNRIGALELAEQRARAQESLFAELSLLNLPIHTQSLYSILLLVPVGAFVIVVLRNVVGVRSFGTFMPVLIALAFRDTGLIGGLVLFSLVVALGLSFRFYLERLRLLLVPRLTAVLTIVVLLLVGLSLLSHRLGIEVGLSVGLFPMVIIAMVIERMSIVWEERGPQDALLEGTGSAVIAVLAFLVMSLETVQHMVFVFPETLLIVLAATLVLGRYTGYRLTELMRFRALAAGGGS